MISSARLKHHILSKINERVRFARKRFGRYEVIDFLAVLFGYANSGERTLEEFYESLQPFAIPFMALFERNQLPSRSALSRFDARWHARETFIPFQHCEAVVKIDDIVERDYRMCSFFFGVHDPTHRYTAVADRRGLPPHVSEVVRQAAGKTRHLV